MNTLIHLFTIVGLTVVVAGIAYSMRTDFRDMYEFWKNNSDH